MIKNYLKIAIRQLRKQKMYSAIKIGGFALSIAACLLIGLYIKNELSYDQSYPDANRIYRLVEYYTHDGKVEKGDDYPAPIAKALKADFPEIEKSGRMMPNSLFPGAGSNELRRADQVENTHEEGFTYADQEFLDILKLPMVYGDRKTALAEPNTMVISKRKADKYFPNQNPIGKVMYLNNDQTKPYRVGGVMENLPETSHLQQFDFLLTLNGVEFYKGEQTNWNASNYPDYLLVRPGTNIAQLEKKITSDINKNYLLPALLSISYKDAEKELQKLSFRLQPITAIHLNSYDVQDEEFKRGDIRFIWLFGAVALFILTIACINFINLSTAKSANRAKEVGLRKVVGSTRFSLINQFLAESMLYSAISFVVGSLLAWALLPYFNTLAATTLVMPWLSPWFIPVILLASVVVGTMAGIYPAFYLSSFKPVSVLKGSISTGSKNSVLRNGLVVFQFTASIILIICTFVIYNQTQYILNRDIGFDKDQVLMLQGTNTLGNDGVKNLKQDLLKLSSVKSVSISDYLPVEGTKRNGNTLYNEGKSKVETGADSQFWIIDNDYLKTFGVKLLEGANFSADDHSGGVIVNQMMVRKLNIKNPIGKAITHGGDRMPIIGVVKDFNYESMKEQIKPIALYYGISPSIVSVKVNGGDMKNTIDQISSVWKNLSPSQPIRYSFLDERFANMYADVQRMGSIFTSFAVLAIIIACLGLFALAAFMAEQRSREIGIRKVLGASVESITRLLSLDFIKLVAIAILVASPIAWWAMTKWLEDFSYRLPISWWVFVLAGAAAIIIALLTVSFQSIKAAIANPIKALRSE